MQRYRRPLIIAAAAALLRLAGETNAADPMLLHMHFRQIPFQFIADGSRDDAFLSLLVGIFIFLTMVVFQEPRIRRLVEPLHGEVAPAEGAHSPSLWWLCAGFLFLLLMQCFLEFRQHYYFTQDDNLAQFLPIILQGCRSFFSGVFPIWDPNQFMGSPTTTVGTYALTYPVTYLSYAIARFLLGNENATLDVFVLLHLFSAYFATFWVLRRERCRPSLAVLGSLCFVLSGFSLIFSRSWYYMSPVLLWTPLLIASVQSIRNHSPDWKWLLLSGLAIGLYFHAGNVQMWVYSVLLVGFGVVVLLATRAMPLRTILPIIAAQFVGLAISLPLLVPEFLATRTAQRLPDSTGIAIGLITLFLPNSLAPSPHPLGWGSGSPPGEMYYSGTVFVVAALVLTLSLLVSRLTRKILANNVWLVCGLLSFLLALGSEGLVWDVISQAPGLNRFRMPFKFLVFLDLFLILAGAVAIERLFQNRRLTRKVELCLAVLLAIVLSYHCSLCKGAFYEYGFRPYPRADPNLLSHLRPKDDLSYPKFLPVAENRSTDLNYFQSFKHQWPSLVNIFSVSGYDGLVSETPAMRHATSQISEYQRQAFIEYGVRYLLVFGEPETPKVSADQVTAYRNQVLTVVEIPGVKPMAFSVADSTTALPVHFDLGGATIDTHSLVAGGGVVLNMLYRSEIHALANGTKLRTGADSWGRILIQIQGGESSVRVNFSPPWMPGFAAGLASLIIGLTLGYYAMRHERTFARTATAGSQSSEN